MTFGDRIKFIRGDLSRNTFGSLIRAHRNAVLSWENEECMPNGEYLKAIHEILNVNLNWLITGIGQPFLDSQNNVGEKVDESDQSISRIVVINRSSRKDASGNQVERRDRAHLKKKSLKKQH